MIKINQSISLEAIKQSDQVDLYALMSRIYPPSYKHLWAHEDCSFYLNTFYNLENLKTELKDLDSEYYFIFYNKNLSGILRLEHNKLLFNKKTTYLNRIYLGEEAQGKGIAKLICDWSETQAKNNQSKSIWLKAMDTQEQALKFYKKQGYIKVDTSRLDFSLLKKDLRGMIVFEKLL